tara:strand:- start:239 stop:1153 length:915 start_codon:yes stop_codon:yes gene_type:complete
VYIPKKKKVYNAPKGTSSEANTLITNALLSNKAVMICRFGSGELYATMTRAFMLEKINFFTKCLLYIKGDYNQFWYNYYLLKGLTVNAGFFPNEKKLVNKYCDLMLEISKDIDILGSWMQWEDNIKQYYSSSIQKVKLGYLEPYYHQNPWSKVLKGKKVLVIHPFEKSIRSQYKKRELLFPDPNILPEFELITIKAVQSIAGNKTEYDTWFDALESMQCQIRNTDFDIALIGAGAYGMPLAAYVKSIGKKSVHIGGALQILFGIKGKRWEDHKIISSFYNEHWVNPSLDEVPSNNEAIEDGCYW